MAEIRKITNMTNMTNMACGRTAVGGGMAGQRASEVELRETAHFAQWGGWDLKGDGRLVFPRMDGAKARVNYSVDLARCTSAANVLDWIMTIAVQLRPVRLTQHSDLPNTRAARLAPNRSVSRPAARAIAADSVNGRELRERSCAAGNGGSGFSRLTVLAVLPVFRPGRDGRALGGIGAQPDEVLLHVPRSRAPCGLDAMRRCRSECLSGLRSRA
jgi:hypothetical protein